MAKEKAKKSKKQSSESRPPGEMLNAHLLALLKGWQACGYDLMNRLKEEGLGSYNSGTVYRSLRQMEKMGLISSMWDTSEDGPARRMYNLTTAGQLFLTNWIAMLETHRRTLDAFMNLATPSQNRRADTEPSDEMDEENDSDE